MTTDRFPQLHCDLCGCLMGEVSLDELEGSFPVGEGPWVCFDCDPDKADIMPKFFVGADPGGVIVLGDGIFVTSARGDMLFVGEMDASHAHASAPAVSLSSYTYLNTYPNQNREREEITGNDAETPCGDDECGFPYCGYPACLDDNQLSQHLDSIILPAWIVKPHEEKIVIRRYYGDCPECSILRVRGDGRYCSYHHALLAEQFEDGSLGWPHA